MRQRTGLSRKLPREAPHHGRLAERGEPDPVVIDEWERKFPRANIGVLLGAKSGIIDVEYDTDEGRQTAERLLDGVQTPTYESGNRSIHRLFRWRDDLPGGAVIHVAGLEIRTGNDQKGAQSVLPPSVHRTGRHYEWIIPPEQAVPAPIPSALLALIANAAGEEEMKGHRGTAPQIDNRELALDALAGLNKSRTIGYDDWLHVGMAIHSVDQSLLSAWDEWSQSCSEKYQPGTCAEHWASFTAGNGVNIGSLVYWAKQDGWCPPWQRNGRTKKGGKKPAGRQEDRQESAFGNVEFVQDDSAEDGELKPLPLPMARILADLTALAGRDLHRTGGKLFAHAQGAEQVDWLLDSSALFGWIQSQLGIISWRGGVGYVTKNEFTAELLRVRAEVAGVETMPHWPPIPGHYYTCPAPTPGDSRGLAELLGRYCFDTELCPGAGRRFHL